MLRKKQSRGGGGIGFEQGSASLVGPLRRLELELKRESARALKPGFAVFFPCSLNTEFLQHFIFLFAKSASLFIMYCLLSESQGV